MWVAHLVARDGIALDRTSGSQRKSAPSHLKYLEKASCTLEQKGSRTPRQELHLLILTQVATVFLPIGWDPTYSLNELI